LLTTAAEMLPCSYCPAAVAVVSRSSFGSVPFRSHPNPCHVCQGAVRKLHGEIRPDPGLLLVLGLPESRAPASAMLDLSRRRESVGWNLGGPVAIKHVTNASLLWFLHCV